MRLALADEAASQALGGQLAAVVRPPVLIFLHGPLGAGKTTFCRGFLRALGHRGLVRSPTYTLCEPYQIGALLCLHCDFYRLADAEEVEYLGLREQLDDQAVLLVEWPEIARDVLPAPDLSITLDYAGEARRAQLGAATPRGAGILTAFREATPGS